MQRPSTTTMLVAFVAGNLADATFKFIAAAVTKSSAMTAQGIYAVVDACNGLLLLLGRRRSMRPANDQHPFGYGLELYFWSLVVAMIFFACGGGMSIVLGIIRLLNSQPLEDEVWAYAVLGASSVFSAITWWFSWRTFRAAQGESSFWSVVHESKDPTIFMVFVEDSATLVGMAIAFIGILYAHLLGLPEVDAVASILIGTLLGAVAILLAREARGLLLGESADREVIERISQLVSGDPAVEHARDPLTMHFGPDEILLNLDIQFRPGLSSQEIVQAVDRIENQIRKLDPRVQRIFIEADTIVGQDGQKQPRSSAPTPKA